MPEFVKVGRVADLPPGKVMSINIRDKWIALANVGGTIYALDNVCLHRGGPLGEGYLDGEKLECPWHGWQFNVKTGALCMNPREKLPIYEVKIEGSEIFVAV